MQKVLRSLVCVALVGAGLMGLFAAPSGAACSTSFSETVPVGDVFTFYIDDRSDTPPVPGIFGGQGTWIYEESNGEGGLQRGGTHFTTDTTGVEIPGETDTCVESGNPDDIWL